MASNTDKKNRIKFVQFHEVFQWDVKRYSSERIKSDYPVVKLGTYIQEKSQRIKLSDYPEDEFGILGVSNKIGIFDSYMEKGKNINQPYKKMEIGWLAYNPYRINVGSIGIRNKENLYEYISPAYVVFNCKESLLPDFLFKLFKTQRFNKIINDNTTGSVRQNLTFDILKTLVIPLPPVNIQKKLLTKYYSRLEKAITQEKEIRKKENEINEFLLQTLNISLEKNEKVKGLSFTRFSQIDRWATDYLFNLNSIRWITQGKYPSQKVKNFLLSYQYGLSLKASEEPIGIPILRMNNINNSELDLNDLKYIQLTNEQKHKSILEKGDLLFNRTNSRELVGKTAIFNLNGDYTFASYLIKLKLNKNLANVEYINYLFNSPIGRIQIDMISRQVSGQANVNAQELQDFIFPLPDIKIQTDIVSTINKIKAEINDLKKNAELNKKQAIMNFEQEVFKN